MFVKKIISLDIGNENIKILQGKSFNNNITIENALNIPTPDNSVEDGVILNMDKLSSYLKEKLQENDIKGNKGIITLDYPNVITRELILPTAKEAELGKMVQYEIEELLPIDMEDYVIDYKKKEEFKDGDLKKLKLLVVAIPKEIVENYMELLKLLKLDPYALDLNSNAIDKLINKKTKINGKEVKEDDTLAFFDIGHKNININIISNYKSAFSRVIERGSRDIDISIANASNLELSDARSKKEEFNLYDETTNSYEIIKEIITGTLDDWTVEINRILSYYRNLELNNKIDQIYIYGGGSKLKGIDKYLERELNINTYILEEITPIKRGKKIPDVNLKGYFNNMGALIRL